MLDYEWKINESPTYYSSFFNSLALSTSDIVKAAQHGADMLGKAYVVIATHSPISNTGGRKTLEKAIEKKVEKPK